MDFSNNAVLTLDQACQYTGFSKNYMYKLTSERVIPDSKPNGKSIFFDREKLEDWMMSKPVVTAAEQDVIADNYVAGRMLQEK